MSIFNRDSTILADYRHFVRSFFTVTDHHGCELVEARLWLEKLLGVRPFYSRVVIIGYYSPKSLVTLNKRESANYVNATL